VSLDERIDRAVADEHLQRAIGTAAGALKERRGRALEAIPDVESVRDAARRSRLDALPRTEALAAEFTAAATARGVQVHRAADGAEAIATVVAIAERCGLRAAVKSKSMATEEIHLNDGLEAAGIAVRETDLGEYIVQLANDRPSHIILPIVHMNRADVGRVVERELRVPFTDEPVELAAIARARLRADFLAADLGITGGNLAVAETGGVVLVSNEGNIRMVTSLPRVHVALVGLDKLVPTLPDAERILRILAPSATGQKSTVYTTLVQGPRTDGDEGPDEVHVILLDNGRSSIRAGGQAEILACIRCGACLNACPVYRRIGGHAYDATYPGPLGSVFMASLPHGRPWDELPSLCTLCGACRDICPVRIDLPGMLLKLRAEKVDAGRSTWTRRLAMFGFAVLMTRPRLYRLARRVGAWWVRRGASGGWRRSAPGLLGRWTRARDLPVPAARSFWDRFEDAPSRDVHLVAPPPSEPPSPAPPPGSSDPVARFVEEAAALSAEVFVEPDAEAVRARVRGLVEGRRTLSWAADHLPYGVAGELERSDRLDGRDLDTRAGAEVGVTGADGAVAATGALILGSRRGRPRAPSLLPPLHVAVLRPEDIHADLEAALVARVDLLAACSSVHVIAGPSRTADIELHLTLGVHGPGRVVIVVGPEGGG